MTLDVKGLYTNIPHEEGINACVELFGRHSSSDLPCEDLRKLIQFVLQNNYFSFNGSFFLQVNGTAMGTKMAPCYANIFMARLEDEFLSKCNKVPLAYYRYIDDIFLVWTHGADELEAFISDLNNFHPSIKFTSEKSHVCVNYLDCSIRLEGHSLQTSVYTKPTDKHTYLTHTSFHPSHLKASIVYSQFLRYRRICSSVQLFVNDSTRLFKYFMSRGYPFKTILHIYQRVSKLERNSLLLYKPKTHSKRIPLVTTFNPLIEPLIKTIKSSYRGLQNDSDIAEIFSDPPVCARRQPPNLRNLLVRSSLQSQETTGGNFPCGKPRCKMCVRMDTSNTIKIGDQVVRTGHYTCDSPNVVYLMYCVKCENSHYLGETGTKFRLRFNNHISSIRHNSHGFPVAEHFNLPNHTITDIRFCILAGGFRNDTHRKQTELQYILKYNTHNQGLNRDLGALSAYNFFRPTSQS